MSEGMFAYAENDKEHKDDGVTYMRMEEKTSPHLCLV